MKTGKTMWLVGLIVIAMLQVVVAQRPPPLPARPPQVPGVPPWPLTAERERAILNDVFARFPDVDREAIMAFVPEHLAPEMWHFRKLAVGRRGESIEFMSDTVVLAMGMIKLQKENPTLFAKRMQQRRVEQRTADMAQAWRRASGEDRVRIEKALRAELGGAFELKQELLRADLADLESEIATLRSLIEQRQSRRDAIVEKRLRDVTQDADELEW